MRVVIRPYESADAEPLREAAVESVAELTPWMPWCHPGYSLEEARGWVELQVRNRAAGASGEHEFVIASPEGRFLGGCGLNQIDAARRSANLGYWVRTSATGRGVAPAAVAALIDWGFAHTGLERIEIAVALGNARSHRVAQKVGAVREGVSRGRLLLHGVEHDVVIYSVTRGRWRS